MLCRLFLSPLFWVYSGSMIWGTKKSVIFSDFKKVRMNVYFLFARIVIQYGFELFPILGTHNAISVPFRTEVHWKHLMSHLMLLEILFIATFKKTTKKLSVKSSENVLSTFFIFTFDVWRIFIQNKSKRTKCGVVSFLINKKSCGTEQKNVNFYIFHRVDAYRVYYLLSPQSTKVNRQIINFNCCKKKRCVVYFCSKFCMWSSVQLFFRSSQFTFCLWSDYMGENLNALK